MVWTPSALSGHALFLSGYKSLPTFGKLLINISHSQQQVEEVIIEHPNHRNFLEAGVQTQAALITISPPGHNVWLKRGQGSSQGFSLDMEESSFLSDGKAEKK